MTTILDIKTRTGTGLSTEIRRVERLNGCACYIVVRDNTLAQRLSGLGWDVRIDPEIERDKVYILPVTHERR